MEMPSPSEEKKEELYLTDYMKKELKNIANWSIFISISTFLFCVVWGLSFITSSLELSSLSSIEMISFLLFILLISLIIISGVILFSFSLQLKKALKHKQAQLLNLSFDYLSRYFIFSSILLAILILWTILVTNKL